MLFFTVFVLFGTWVLSISQGSFPEAGWLALSVVGVPCLLLYAIGIFLWISGRRNKAVDKVGGLLLSASFFFPGILLLVIVVFFSTRLWELQESVRISYWWLSICFGGIALGLMGVAVIIWKRTKARTRTVTMGCPYCGYYVPGDFDSCPHCGKKIR